MNYTKNQLEIYKSLLDLYDRLDILFKIIKNHKGLIQGGSGGIGGGFGGAFSDLSGQISLAQIPDDLITNIKINSAAAIAKTKLASLGIVNADVAAGAAIAYSKLSLTGAILNADLAGSIAKSKISSTGTWTAAEIPDLAASKITSGTMATARLGSGSAGSTNFLRGDQTWATAGAWEIVETYEAASAQSTKTFSFTADDMDDTSMYVLVWDLMPTAALNLLLRINGDTTANYNVDGSRIRAGAETLIDLNSQTSAQICSSTLLSASTSGASGMLYILLSKAGSTDWPMGHSSALAGGTSGYEDEAFQLVITSASLSSITILTSTSTWQIGTRMTLYKVKRS